MGRLLVWMAKLGGCKGHRALVVADQGTPFNEAAEIHGVAARIFEVADLITNDASVAGWPSGANSLFLAAARHCAEPFLWLESDCVPMRAGWLDEIAKAWSERPVGKLFLGAIYDCTQPFLPSRVMSGIAVYSPDGVSLLPLLKDSPRAWDVDGAEAMVAHGMHTAVIRHFWGTHGMPPTFVARKDAHSPVNAITLEDIPPEAVLFHRNKDGTLIELLRRKMGFVEPDRSVERLVLVLGFCGKDANLAEKNIEWMIKLSGQINGTLVLQTDGSIQPHHLQSIIRRAQCAFKEVVPSRLAHIPHGWPHGPNLMWQCAARLMASWQCAWIWSEPDAVFVKADGLDQLSIEYAQAGKPFMGHVVGGMGHMNGVGVYPPDVARYCPSALSAIGSAWDMVLHPSIAPYVHKANHLIQHCRAAVNGCCLDQHGEAPTFRSLSDLSMVAPSAVLFHPSKDGTLIDRLIQKL